MWRRLDSDRGKFVEEAISREICPAFRAMKMRQERRKWKEQTKLIETKCSSISYKIYPPVIEETIEIRQRTLDLGRRCRVPNVGAKEGEPKCLMFRNLYETINEPVKIRVDRNKENRSTAERACISEHQAKLRSGADINSSDFWNMNY